MGNSKRHFLLILLLAGFFSTLAQEKLTFQEVDRMSYKLFEKQDWKPLKKLSKQAFSEGFDYYYLRMRAGIACFETKQYFDAADNFEKALSFNSTDPVAGEYLYYCWINLNNSVAAIEVYEQLSPSLQKKMESTLPKMRQINLEGGPLFSNQEEIFNELDLDGEGNIYGEADITQNGYYFSAGFGWQFKKGFEIFAAYSLVSLNKIQEVKIQDTPALSYQYPLTQQQFYMSGAIPVGRNFTIIPAANFILQQYNMVVPKFNESTVSYLFPVENFKFNSYIGYLSIAKDFQIVKTSLFGAYSNLNEETQYQAGLKVILFPLQNLNFYLASTFLDHNNGSQNNLVFGQMIGGRVLKPLWAEINATFGQMTNYYDNQAFTVYNFAGDMNFKGSAKLIYLVNSNIKITAEYLYFSRVGEYLVYENTTGDPLNPHPVTMTQEFNNQLVLLGINWKF
ncbi:MAG TPA: hypothetical protein VIN10_01285 [Bacteroidales bacterium]